MVPLPRGRARSAVLCAALTALALTLSACATSQKQLSAETVGAAHGESSPSLPSRLAPGTLLSAVPITTAAALPGAAVTFSVRYVSSDDSGNRIVVTGLISLPRGFAPRGGWPVLSWAHGTTGVIPACQPSQDTATGMDHDYLGRIDLTLTSWVNQGYVVAQTDYASYNGIQPYLDGTVEANNVIDIVQAARQLSRQVGKTWFVAGHSQGGQASLFTAAFAQGRAPQLKFLGRWPWLRPVTPARSSPPFWPMSLGLRPVYPLYRSFSWAPRRQILRYSRRSCSHRLECNCSPRLRPDASTSSAPM